MSSLMYQSNVDPSNMQKANQWYTWALQVAINSGDFESSWRYADTYQKTNFRTSPQMTAYGYLEGQRNPIHTRDESKRIKTVRVMEKMLKMWESKIESETKQKEESEKAFKLLKEGYIVPQIPNNVVTELQHNAALKLQSQTKLDNAAQKAAFWALRNGGKIEAAAQMANPISTQTYNIKGEKIVVLGKGIKSQARIQMEKETARIQVEKQKQQEKTSQRQSVADNSKNLPNFDAQSQKYNQNNNVNPSSLYTNQPLIVTGQSQNSSVDVGINSNANYNYATQFNDYQTANPAQSVNLGQQVNPPYFTAGLSSIPDNNEVQTSDLGGDIQHQETDVNTNLEYELPLSQQSTKNVNWDFVQSITAGSSLIPLVGIGLLAYFMGKRK